MPDDLFGYNKPFIKFDGEIESGGFSTVYAGKTSNKMVAIKRIRIKRKKRKKFFFRFLLKLKSNIESRKRIQTEVSNSEETKVVLKFSILQELEMLKLCQSKYVLKYLDYYKKRTHE